MMRKLIFIAVLLCSLPSSAQIAFGTAASSGNRGTSTVTTISVSTGQALTVVVVTDNTGALVTGVTDTGGDTFTKLATATNGAIQTTVWGVLSANASSSVTCTISSNSGDVGCIASTYTGVSAFGATPVTLTGTTANPHVALTIATGGNWVVGGLGNNTATASTAGTGSLRKDVSMTNRASSTADLVDNTSASAVSVTTSVTHGSSTWAAAAIELVAAGGGGSPAPTCTLASLGVGSC